MPLGAFFLLLLQVIKRKYQLLNKNIDYEPLCGKCYLQKVKKIKF